MIKYLHGVNEERKNLILFCVENIFYFCFLQSLPIYCGKQDLPLSGVLYCFSPVLQYFWYWTISSRPVHLKLWMIRTGYIFFSISNQQQNDTKKYNNMNRMLQWYQIAIIIFKDSYSVSIINLTVEQYQQLIDLAADVHSIALGQPVISNFFHIPIVAYPKSLSSNAIFLSN